MSNFRKNWGVYCMVYLSHCLSAWGDRMWDFAVGLYMIILFPESLLVAAILGFIIALAVLTFGSLLGAWIDNTKRLTSAISAIITQNTTIAFAGAGLALNFLYRDEIAGIPMLQPTIFALIIFASVIAQLASVASDIVIERDWIVILTEGDESSLATMNSVMRTIDLSTKILAPVAIGTLISYSSQMTSAIFVAGWNIISAFVEIYLLVLIHRRTPLLSKQKSVERNETKWFSFRNCATGWSLYFQHPVKLAGLAFSCLFMSALGFDQITIGYMFSEGVDESLIGIITAMGAIVGIIGSVSYPYLRKRLGKNSTAIVGYIANATCLFLCVVSIFMRGSPFEPDAILRPFQAPPANSSVVSASSLTVIQLWEDRQNIFYFIGGIVLARFGLWVADLSTAQLLQDTVEESKRGTINGVQNSMNQLMDMTKFLLVIFLPSPQTFGYLIIASWIFSCISCAMFSAYSLNNRGGNQRSLRRDDGREDSLDETTQTLLDEHTPLLQKQ